MYCLLCHQKISRWRRLKGASQFCCDEHAEQHKRETMGRLLDYDQAASAAPQRQKHEEEDDPIHRLAAVTGHYQHPSTGPTKWELAPLLEVSIRRQSPPRKPLLAWLPGDEILRPRVKLVRRVKPMEVWNAGAVRPPAPAVAAAPVRAAAPPPPPVISPPPPPRPSQPMPPLAVDLPATGWDGHPMAGPAVQVLRAAHDSLTTVRSGLRPRLTAGAARPVLAFWEEREPAGLPAAEMAPLPAAAALRPPPATVGSAPRHAVVSEPLPLEGLGGLRPASWQAAAPAAMVVKASQPLGAEAGLQSVASSICLPLPDSGPPVSAPGWKGAAPAFQEVSNAPRLLSPPAPSLPDGRLWPQPAARGLLWLPVAPAAHQLWKAATSTPAPPPAGVAVEVERAVSQQVRALLLPAADMLVPEVSLALSSRNGRSSRLPASVLLARQGGEVIPVRAELAPAGIGNRFRLRGWSAAPLAARSLLSGPARAAAPLSVFRTTPVAVQRVAARFLPGPISASPSSSAPLSSPGPALWSAPRGTATPPPRRPNLTSLAPPTAVQLPTRLEARPSRIARVGNAAGAFETRSGLPSASAAPRLAAEPLAPRFAAAAGPGPEPRRPSCRITRTTPPLITPPERRQAPARALAAGGLQRPEPRPSRRLDEERLRRFVPVPILAAGARPTEAPEPAVLPAPGERPAAPPPARARHDAESAFVLRPSRPAPPPPASRPLPPPAVAHPAFLPPPLDRPVGPVERIEIDAPRPGPPPALVPPAPRPAAPPEPDTLRMAMDAAERRRLGIGPFLAQVSGTLRALLLHVLGTRAGRLSLLAAGMLITLLVAGRLLIGPLRAGIESATQPMEERAFFLFEENFTAGLRSWSDAEVLARQEDGLVQVKPGATLFQPSLRRVNYQFEFEGRIQQGGLGWIVRAADQRHFYAFKLGWRGRGRDRRGVLLRTAVVNTALPAPEKFDAVALPFELKENTMYQVEVSVAGDRITTLIDGRGVDSFTDSQLKAGGVGFFADKGDAALIRSLAVSGNDDATGRTLAWVRGFGQFLESKVFGVERPVAP